MADNLAYQEELRDEMLNGKVVLMSPRPAVNHNLAMGNIYRAFANRLDGKKCLPFADGTDVYLTEKDRVVPDVMIICKKEIIKRNGIHGDSNLFGFDPSGIWESYRIKAKYCWAN